MLDNAIVYIILNSIAVFNIAVLSAFLIIRKENSWPNYLLALIFIIPGLYFVDNLIIWTGAIASIPFSFFLVQILANLFPIAVYRYVSLLISSNKRMHPLLISGSIISSLYSIGLLLYFYSLSEEQQLEYLQLLRSGQYPESMNIYNLVFYACQMAYLLVMYLQIRRYERKVRNNLSDINSVKLSFIKQFITLLGVLNFSLILFYITLPIVWVDYGLLPIIMTVIYMFTIYFSVQNNALFSNESYDELKGKNDSLQEECKEEKCNEITTNDIRWQKSVNTLEVLFKEEKIYKKQNLNLALLSELAQEQPYFISQILNQHFHKSFFDYINEIRVEEAKDLLRSFNVKADTIENIAFEVGFNSRASFYRSFKKVTGKNPHDFVSPS